MTQRPRVTCLILTSIDGRLHPSRFTTSPQGARKDWSRLYEAVHAELSPDAWLVGRVTMEEMAKGTPHPPKKHDAVERPMHLVSRGAAMYAVSIDRSGTLHFNKPDIGGDPVIVFLGRDVADSHLAELTEDGISYVVAPDDNVDLKWVLETLKAQLGINHLMVEGGAAINGAFFAAGLVDELNVLVAPALDGARGIQGIVEFDEIGLAGRVELSLVSCETMDHGVLRLRYSVAPA